jgi:hypothetical protein
MNLKNEVPVENSTGIFDIFYIHVRFPQITLPLEIFLYIMDLEEVSEIRISLNIPRCYLEKWCTR